MLQPAINWSMNKLPDNKKI